VIASKICYKKQILINSLEGEGKFSEWFYSILHTLVSL